MTPVNQTAATRSASDLLTEVLAVHGLKPRPSQGQMANAIADALTNKTKLLVKAPTGTGKSLAYLSGALSTPYRPIIIATSGIQLQQQLATKDLPMIVRVRQGLTWGVLKGRENYLCRSRYERFAKDHHVDRCEVYERQSVQKLTAWADTQIQQHMSGDRDNCPPGVEGGHWAAVCGNRGSCRHCEDCFYGLAKSAAMLSEVIITNHTALIAHMVYTGLFTGRKPAFIIDEVHKFGDTCRGFLGQEITADRMRYVVRDGTAANISGLVDVAGEVHRVLEILLTERLRNGKFFNPGDGVWANALEAAKNVNINGRGLDAVEAEILYDGRDFHATPLSQDEETTLHGISAVQELCKDLSSINRPAVADDTWIRSVDSFKSEPRQHRRNRNQYVNETHEKVTVQRFPLLVAGFVRAWFDQFDGRVVATTATSPATRTSVELLLGYPVDSGINLPHVFDLANRVRVYIPTTRQVTPPGEGPTPEEIMGYVRKCMSATSGGILVLCTSWAKVYGLRSITPLDAPIAFQEKGNAAAVIHALKNREVRVAVGTKTMWTGIDLPGELVTVVILDKLPFESQDDPVMSSMCKHIDSKIPRGGWLHVSQANMLMQLEQGAGRLIRTETDYGAILILDSRIPTKAYYGAIKKALAPAPILVGDFDPIIEFLKKHRIDNGCG